MTRFQFRDVWEFTAEQVEYVLLRNMEHFVSIHLGEGDSWRHDLFIRHGLVCDKFRLFAYTMLGKFQPSTVLAMFETMYSIFGSHAVSRKNKR